MFAYRKYITQNRADKLKTFYSRQLTAEESGDVEDTYGSIYFEVT